MVSNRVLKIALARQMLTDDLAVSAYAINKACKAKYGSAMSYPDIKYLRDQLKPQVSEPSDPHKISSGSFPMLVPDDPYKLRRGPFPEHILPTPPMDFIEAFRVVHEWMKQSGAIEVVFRPSVTICNWPKSVG